MCVDGELCAFVWSLKQMICEAESVPHKFDVMKVLASGDLRLKSATDCGFQSAFSH